KTPVSLTADLRHTFLYLTQNGLAGQCKGSRSPTTVFLAATTHANSTNANIRLSKETWVLSARVMVGAIVRPSRVGAVALVESVLQKKHPRNARAKRIVWDGR
ncbi:hypothetical protein, partial [Bifidobacterium longum]|uniref:hypothetical protein n=1 Tax=Bifidobacterium longum TaxID=216816 RepID=UPI001E4230FF